MNRKEYDELKNSITISQDLTEIQTKGTLNDEYGSKLILSQLTMASEIGSITTVFIYEGDTRNYKIHHTEESVDYIKDGVVMTIEERDLID